MAGEGAQSSKLMSGAGNRQKKLATTGKKRVLPGSGDPESVEGSGEHCERVGPYWRVSYVASAQRQRERLR